MALQFSMADNPFLHYDSADRVLICKDDWTLNHVSELIHTLDKIKLPQNEAIVVDGSNLKNLDTAGAWCLIDLKNRLGKRRNEVKLSHFAKKQMQLVSLVEEKHVTEPPPPKEIGRVEEIGRYSVAQFEGFISYLSFVGLLSTEFLRVLVSPRHWRIPAITTTIYRAGFQALPIIALLSFMIGVVITYQMGLQLRNYGANIYIVDLLGLAILREFGPLLTAIMVAGRTGSAFTAQLGMMKINQEIDALNTMGVTPSELLLLPRIIGLFIVLPLLTIWADIFGVFGGMLMSKSMLNITPIDFLTRFPHVIKLKNLLIGLGKAPVFALIIASIGCYEGMRVGTSADSVGRNTTRSVVLAIFFIIVADAVFSILLSKLKL